MSPKCDNCGKGAMKVTRENYQYKESGLPNVVLVGVEVRRCPECGTTELALPRVAELHRVIASMVIHKPARLSGLEVRYLRKFLGWSGADFAEHMGVAPGTVSNWENDRDTIGTASDRALRLMVAHGSPVQDYGLDELKKIGADLAPPMAVRVSKRAGGWGAEASA
jgi:putative zinc finger/helix-turn-helix YgiT family protein